MGGGRPKGGGVPIAESHHVNPGMSGLDGLGMLALGRKEMMRSEGGEGGGSVGYNTFRDREGEKEHYGDVRGRTLDELLAFLRTSGREGDQERYRELEADILRYAADSREVEKDSMRFSQNSGSGRFRG